MNGYQALQVAPDPEVEEARAAAVEECLVTIRGLRAIGHGVPEGLAQDLSNLVGRWMWKAQPYQRAMALRAIAAIVDMGWGNP